LSADPAPARAGRDVTADVRAQFARTRARHARDSPRVNKRTPTMHRNARSTFCGFESLERRSLMSATISGAVKQDLSGNGLTADDTPLAGVIVKLYKDVNANGQLDAADGAAISSKTSAAATGAFAFTGLSAGKYLLQETPGPNQVRTAPLLSSTIAINASNSNGTYGANIFANYVKTFDKSALSSITYTINGTKTVTSLVGQVKEGDTVKANFTVAAGKTVTLSLVSYKATAPTSNFQNLQLQQLSEVQTGTFTAGKHCLTVKVPNCYFQVDFVGGKAIDKFGAAGSNILYGAQDRLISYDNGGTQSCDCGEKTGREGLTPGYWKNHTDQWSGYTTTQTLESVFDVPDSLGLDNKTLLEALNFGGGGGVQGAAQNLFRHAVAAILNAGHPLVDYAMTTSSIISGVNSALASNNATTINSLKDQLDAFNNAGGGIDAHGNPI
jgi:hypothetical protein